MCVIGGGALLVNVRGSNLPIASAARTHIPRITKSKSLGLCRNWPCRTTEIGFAVCPPSVRADFCRARMAREIGTTLLA